MGSPEIDAEPYIWGQEEADIKIICYLSRLPRMSSCCLLIPVSLCYSFVTSMRFPKRQHSDLERSCTRFWTCTKQSDDALFALWQNVIPSYPFSEKASRLHGQPRRISLVALCHTWIGLYERTCTSNIHGVLYNIWSGHKNSGCTKEGLLKIPRNILIFRSKIP